MPNTEEAIPPTPDQLLTRREAASRLSISVRKLDSFVANGEIPKIEFGRSVRFAQHDLDAFIEASKRGQHS